MSLRRLVCLRRWNAGKGGTHAAPAARNLAGCSGGSSVCVVGMGFGPARRQAVTGQCEQPAVRRRAAASRKQATRRARQPLKCVWLRPAVGTRCTGRCWPQRGAILRQRGGARLALPTPATAPAIAPGRTRPRRAHQSSPTDRRSSYSWSTVETPAPGFTCRAEVPRVNR